MILPTLRARLAAGLPGGRGEEPAPIFMLAPGELPTTDYYLTARLAGPSAGRALRADARLKPPFEALPEGAFVVIVRHASPAWLELLYRQRGRLRGVAYLMDDDIPAAWRCRDVPLDYGLWTSGRYWRIRRGLARLCDRLWVSTPELARRYPGAVVVPPLPFEVGGESAPMGCLRWGYHGSRIHHRELRWLAPIVEAVQQAVPEAEIEVFGGAGVRRLFAHVPRVTVMPPLSWPRYLEYCRHTRLAVGLAPSLPGRFNAARAHTKVFDILRCGGVGLFSDRDPYAAALADSGAVLLPDEPGQWVTWATRLLREEGTRMRQFVALRDWAMRSGSAPAWQALTG